MKSIRTTMIAGAITLAAAISLLLGLVLDREIETLVHNQIVETLLRETILVRPTLESGSLTRVQVVELMNALGLRMTLIDSTGRVRFDSNVDSARLSSVENHLSRPEVQGALHLGVATDTRLSATTGVEQLYAARSGAVNAVIDGEQVPVAFIRLSISLSEANSKIVDVRARVIVAGFFILVLVTLTAMYFARRLLRPIQSIVRTAHAIGEGDLSLRINLDTPKEIAELGQTINDMVHKLQSDIRELERLSKYRTEFLGDVSHELRTPIFAIQGSVETVLGDDNMPLAVRRSFLGTALRNTTRLSALVSDLIDISRIESKELRLSMRYFDIVPLMQDIADDLRRAAERKGLTMHVIVPEHEVSVYGDRERLRQVIINLTDNAVKNTERGTVTLRVEEYDGHAKISVVDTGVGISEEHLPRIFERFYRVDKDRSRASGGTGLGLAIVKHIVEAHGSKIYVESVVDHGSTFWFELPT